GVDGLELELKMLINTGQNAIARDWMKPEHEEKLGDLKANWINAQLGAASGDYRFADQHIPNMFQTVEGIKAKLPLRTVMALRIGQAVLAVKSDTALLPFLWFQARRLNDEANNRTLRGLLALEAGNHTEAQEHFRRAKAFWASPAGIPYQEASAEARTGNDI